MTKMSKNIIQAVVALLFTVSMAMSATTSFAEYGEVMNPCAKANPCGMANPCAKHNPCGTNPCGANPCAMNPCGANPCGNPCGNPCSPAEAADISGDDAEKIYKKLSPSLLAGYAKSGISAAKEYTKWSRFNKTPYVSDTHGTREVNNYSNRDSYGKYEEAGTMTEGTILAKDSFLVNSYSLIMPNGMVVGTSGGKGSQNVNFCADCHNAAEDQDYMFFLPEEHRK